MHPRRFRRTAAAVSIGLVATLWQVGPAHAASANGCSGQANSTTDGGSHLDAVAAPGFGGTEKNPFTIQPDGPVTWNGSTTGVITNGTWTVTSSLFTTSGSFDNDDQDQESDGTKKLTDYVPAAAVMPGIYEVDVEVTGDGGTCTVAGFIDIDMSPFESAWTFAALLFLLLAVMMFILGRPDMAEYFADMATRPGSPMVPPPDALDGGAP